MSAIIFNAREGEARVSGRERHLVGSMTQHIAWGFIAYPTDEELVALAKLAGIGYITPATRDLERAVRLALNNDSREHNGFSWFNVAVNTLTRLGSDEITFVGRLHGQCEVHAWVDDPERPWLAALIKRALAAGVLRNGQGWDGVLELLADPGTGPVVMSYTVSDDWPNLSFVDPPKEIEAIEDEEERAEAVSEWFYGLPNGEAWDLCLEALRAESGGRRWTPDTWHTVQFGDHGTVLDVLKSLRTNKP